MKKFFAMMVLFMFTSFIFVSCGDDDEEEPAKVTEYTIKYDANGGTGTIANTVYKAGDQVTLSDGSGFSRDGYAFMGWSNTPDGTNLDVNAINGKDVTLYAVWQKVEVDPNPNPNPEPNPEPEPVAEFTIKYDANGGTGTIASTTYKAGEQLTISDGTGFTREGYTFKGWSTSADGTDLDMTNISGKDITLYAVWEQNPAENYEFWAGFVVSPELQMQPSMNVNIYTDQIQGDDISYSWDFGDGKGEVWANNSEYLSTLIHTYDTYGEYTITLTVKSKDKSAEAKQTIKIQPAPPISVKISEKLEGVAPFTLQLEGSVMYYDAVIWDINSVSNGTTTSIAKVTANASDGAKDYTFENPGLYYVYVYATGPGAEGEVYMRTDTVKVESASAPEGKPLAAFFPTGKEAGNVAAWYSRTTGTDKEGYTEGVFLFKDGTVIITSNKVAADGSVSKSVTEKAMGMALVYSLTDGSTFEKGTINVGVQMMPNYAQATVANGVLSLNITGIIEDAQYTLQDNANIPAPSDPTK
ncbi:MAG: InlB B-repeat-containing protein [Bacteroidales bacterium]|nr:InlB B-repeat-containing protein [Bacteroidales bacterium]